jgi:hypothetical protein
VTTQAYLFFPPIGIEAFFVLASALKASSFCMFKARCLFVKSGLTEMLLYCSCPLSFLAFNHMLVTTILYQVTGCPVSGILQGQFGLSRFGIIIVVLTVLVILISP